MSPVIPKIQVSKQRFDIANLIQDLSASVVVFLISLPLCMAIAIASGMPPQAGLVTAIVGGLLAAPVGGSPLQISGPAAGLTVIIAGIAVQNGFINLAQSVALAGLLQLASGSLGLAQWFRAVPPSVIKGMLSGIGVLILASQLHVMLDDKTQATGIANIISIFDTLAKALSGSQNHHDAAIVGIVSMGTLIVWQKLFARRLVFIPSALIAVGAGTLWTHAFHAPIHLVQMPSNIFDSLHFISLPADFDEAKMVFANACLIAFIASAETLLTAAALDKMHTGKRTDFDKELRGQGLGNLLCGLLCSLPMTGVMVRSGANVAAGATSKFSAIFAGLWLLIFSAFFTSIVGLIPVASLAALLVYMGYELANLKGWKEIVHFGRGELAIYLTTLLGIVTYDLLTGIAAGVALSLGKLIYTFSRLEVRLEQEFDVAHLWLRGSATFLRLPQLTSALDRVTPGAELHIHLEDLSYIDHACLDLILSWDKQAKAAGGCLVIDWTTLTAAFRDRRRSVRTASGTYKQPALATAWRAHTTQAKQRQSNMPSNS